MQRLNCDVFQAARLNDAVKIFITVSIARAGKTSMMEETLRVVKALRVEMTLMIGKILRVEMTSMIGNPFMVDMASMVEKAYLPSQQVYRMFRTAITARIGLADYITAHPTLYQM